jgi:murein DD-endopeptidase MepM/ murein hydrolase activator NlpD
MPSPQRRWTLLIVPHGCDSPRSISLSEKTVRHAIAAASTLGLIAVIGVGVGISQLAAHATRRDDGSLRVQLTALQARVDTLDDTLRIIERRDDQIRLLAGLPADSQTARTADREPSSTGAEGALASPQLSGLALGSRTDIDGLIKRANSLAASFAEVSDTLARNVEKLARIPSIMPTAGWLSSAFSRSRFHPILHYARPHEGIDVSAPMGAPIVAPAAGVVTRVGRETGYGLILEIDHGDGIRTKFAHCSRISVREGQRVKRGQEIANVGNSGLSTGPHLHYEIHVNGKVVDPLTYVLPGGAIPD